MAVDDFLVPPVERNLMHLVVRQVRPKEERDKGKSPYKQPDFGGRDKKKAQAPATDNCVSGSKVDCKV
ncbi:MAG: hypothetical protein H6Q76_717 [Firmicutes bacterium]|nr:hypothetical protein [Bacillota bacterium]